MVAMIEVCTRGTEPSVTDFGLAKTKMHYLSQVLTSEPFRGSGRDLEVCGAMNCEPGVYWRDAARKRSALLSHSSWLWICVAALIVSTMGHF